MFFMKKKEFNMSTKVAGIPLQTPVFNASGPRCTTKEELEALGNSKASAIMTKSCTLESRNGNPEPRYYDFPDGSINSMGLPNPGYLEYVRMIPELAKFRKPVFASVSGLCLPDNIMIIKAFNKIKELDAIELNLSCPNVPGKPQMAYDMEQTKEVLKAVGEVCVKPWGVKLPPYFDFAHFHEMAEILNSSSVKFVTCINSPGNGLVIDAETESVVIKPKGGFGGIGGRGIKPFGLSNVRKFRELLRPDISVIGVGGIWEGKDVFEYILAGADAVQVGTAFQRDDPSCFERLLQELRDVMKKKGYSSLDDFRGKLKTL